MRNQWFALIPIVSNALMLVENLVNLKHYPQWKSIGFCLTNIYFLSSPKGYLFSFFQTGADPGFSWGAGQHMNAVDKNGEGKNARWECGGGHPLGSSWIRHRQMNYNNTNDQCNACSMICIDTHYNMYSNVGWRSCQPQNLIPSENQLVVALQTYCPCRRFWCHTCLVPSLYHFY